MDLQMNTGIGAGYSSSSQRIRVITESWAGSNLFCPYCGSTHIQHFQNNKPVADFYCPHCNEEYELKSKNGEITSKINDGAYDTMIKRIQSANNPNFFFMHYNLVDMRVVDLIVIPKYYFTPDIIERRKPLADTARRAGWVGCNIAISRIPKEGRIFIVENGMEQEPESVISKVKRTAFIRQYNVDARGWILDILNCLNQIKNRDFTLEQMYWFSDYLALRYPNNHHIREKIRQQLQVLRDQGIIEFCGRGLYRKL